MCRLINITLQFYDQVLEPVMSQCLFALQSLGGVDLQTLLHELNHELLVTGEGSVDLRGTHLARFRIVEPCWE